MRCVFSLVLAMLVLLQAGSGAGRVLGYQLHRATIAATLCENRARPQLQCNGKCHLRKQLRQDEQQKTPLEHETGAMPLFCQALEPWQPAPAVVAAPVRFPHLRAARLSPPSFAIFTPPWA